jgi:polyphosphate kinase 2 (PPK2 family)
MKAINDFEQLLSENHTHILKFYLHISKEEQTERLKERLTIARKMWKYNSNDFKEAEYWADYQAYYEDCFNDCGEIPWIIVPDNKKWYKEFFITEALHNLLKKLHLKYPILENNKI